MAKHPRIKSPILVIVCWGNRIDITPALKDRTNSPVESARRPSNERPDSTEFKPERPSPGTRNERRVAPGFIPRYLIVSRADSRLLSNRLPLTRWINP